MSTSRLTVPVARCCSYTSVRGRLFFVQGLRVVSLATLLTASSRVDEAPHDDLFVAAARAVLPSC